MQKKFFAVASVAAGAWFLLWTHHADAANLYAQYFDDATSSVVMSPLGAAYADALGHVSHLQVEMNILNDSQRGVSAFCPVAPNTGVLVNIFRGGNQVYIHCVTSAEAAGKLGQKAVYTFDDVNINYGGAGDTGVSVQFSSSGSFDAQVYGTRGSDGAFYPYLVFGDSDGVGSPVGFTNLAQYFFGTTTTIPENGVASGSAVSFGATMQMFFASDTAALQIEVEPIAVPLSGSTTITTHSVGIGEVASGTVAGLAPGAYHWAARAVDRTGGFTSPWIEFRSPGNIDFNIPTATLPEAIREPVVIIPGIMGSRLVRADGGEAWPSASQMITSSNDGYLDFLALDADGTPFADRQLSPTDILRNVTTSFLGVTFEKKLYQNLIDMLVQNGYTEGRDLFAAPYDWRISIESSTDSLASVIARAVRISPTGKVNVIAHSMGGLLLEEYLASHTDIDKAILLGVPQLGTPRAYQMLNYGDDLGMNWLGLGLNPREAKMIVENMPAIYEMLPSARYATIAGDYIHDLRNGKDEILDHGHSMGPNAPLSHLADNFHDAVDAMPIHVSSIYNIIGCNRPTIVGFDLYDGGVVEVRRDIGDGTIPELSALNLANSSNTYFILGDQTGTDHMGLATDAIPLEFIKDILAGTGTTTLPRGISMNPPDCMGLRPRNFEVSVNGPVTLDIYDSQGRELSMATSGILMATIPGAEYDVFGSNLFALVPALPAGEFYTIVGRASDAGIFRMQIKEYDGAMVSSTVTYPLISLASASTTAQLHFVNPQSDLALKMDNDGDGAMDDVIQPVGNVSPAPPSPTSTPSSPTSTPPVNAPSSGGSSGGSSVAQDPPAHNQNNQSPPLQENGKVLGVSTTTAARGSATPTPDLKSQLIALKQKLIALQLGSNCAAAFRKNLQEGATGNSVQLLQQTLNKSSLTQVAADGPGSPGHETEYFGPARARAVGAFQEIFAADILTPQQLTAGTGIFGTLTRKKLNQLCKK